MHLVFGCHPLSHQQQPHPGVVQQKADVLLRHAVKGGQGRCLGEQTAPAAPLAAHTHTHTPPASSLALPGQRLLAEHGEVHLSALGLAVSTMVSIAEILKHDGLAVETRE